MNKMQKIALAKVLGYLDGDGSIGDWRKNRRRINQVAFFNTNFDLYKI